MCLCCTRRRFNGHIRDDTLLLLLCNAHVHFVMITHDYTSGNSIIKYYTALFQLYKHCKTVSYRARKVLDIFSICFNIVQNAHAPCTAKAEMGHHKRSQLWALMIAYVKHVPLLLDFALLLGSCNMVMVRRKCAWTWRFPKFWTRPNADRIASHTHHAVRSKIASNSECIGQSDAMVALRCSGSMPPIGFLYSF